MDTAQASMSINDVFHLILKRLACVTDRVAYFGQDELDGFSIEIVDALKNQGVLSQCSDAKELICLGCELYCNRPVRFQRTIGLPVKAFIACNVPDGGDGEDDVPLSRLTRFQTTERQLAQLIAQLCGINKVVTNQNRVWTLGVYAGKKHHAVLSLDFNENILLVNGVVLSLAEVVSFTAFALNIDTSKITQAVDFGLAPVGKAQNKAIRQSKIQIRNEKWHKEYLRLKSSNPNKSDTWISIQIEKLPIAEGKDSETIRKNMK